MDPKDDTTDDAVEQSEESGGSFLDDYPSETIRAVAVDEATAGVELTVYDLDELDFPPMFEIHQYYPPEDDQEGESVYVNGEHEVLQLISGLAEILTERVEEVDWDDV